MDLPFRCSPPASRSFHGEGAVRNETPDIPRGIDPPDGQFIKKCEKSFLQVQNLHIIVMTKSETIKKINITFHDFHLYIQEEGERNMLITSKTPDKMNLKKLDLIKLVTYFLNHLQGRISTFLVFSKN